MDIGEFASADRVRQHGEDGAGHLLGIYPRVTGEMVLDGGQEGYLPAYTSLVQAGGQRASRLGPPPCHCSVQDLCHV